jgi:hypothetical protein
MSVDKVSPLSPSPVDSVGTRSGGHSRAAPSSPKRAPDSMRALSSPLTTIEEADAVATSELFGSKYYNLSSSALAAISIGSDQPSPRGASGGALASSAYAASRAPQRDSSALLAGRLPQDAVARLTVAAIRENATAQGKPIIHALQTLTVADTASLPSQNEANAQPALQTSFVVNDKSGAQTTVDFYLTRTGLSDWEVVAYDRLGASTSGGFPYSSPPLLVDHLVIDPATGQIMASIAGQLFFTRPNGESPDGRAALLAFAGMIFLASIICTLVVANEGHALAASAIAAAGAYGAMLAAGSKRLF